MRRYTLFFALLLVAHFAFLVVAQPAPSAAFDVKPIDAVVERAMKEFAAPGVAVVIVKDGEVVYLKGFGVREKGKPERVTPDTVFAIASCTKAFAATVIAMQGDEGKLKWDDKVYDHLDYFRLRDEAADREVTLRDLLCHRTGMPRHDLLWSAFSGVDSEAVIRRWVKGQSSTSFRSAWEYSNVPFTTAGVIAGKIDNSDWAGVLQKRIFDPLGMTASSCRLQASASRPDLAMPHYYGFDKAITAIAWDYNDHVGAAGAINSSARDLGKWLQFQLGEGKVNGKQLISARALRETHTPQMLMKAEGPFAIFFPPQHTRFASYGLGWFVHDYRGVTCVSHGGTLNGFRAQCMMVPEKKLGVFVLCNLRPSPVTEIVAKTAIDTMLGLPAEDWIAFHRTAGDRVDANVADARKKRDAARKPDTKPSLSLKEYVGVYDEPAYGRLEVILENDQLMGRFGKYTLRLEHYHFDTFTAVLVAPKEQILTMDRTTVEWQFRLGGNGAVEGLKGFGVEFKKAAK
jgi:CubicO group peptidase (beta-lactamase class C family)